MTFYQVLTLASIVEREAMLDQEKPLIAGVYANRLDPKKFPLGLLQSDPTIFYVHDSLELAKVPVDQVDDVHVLGADQGRPDRRDPAGRPGRLQHVHEQGPAAGPDRHADR